MTLDPRLPEFWNEDALRKDTLRIHHICADCRLCFKYCGSFPTLFKAVDAHEGDVQQLTQGVLDEVVDLCFQCKLCYVNCPYTPEQHEWAVDFPRLMLRSVMVRKKREHHTMQDRFLSNPDLAGKLGGAGVPLSNWANRLPVFRAVLEGVIGVHRRRWLPKFHRVSFLAWAKRKLRSKPSTSGEKAAFFATCSVNHHWPQIGQAAVAVLKHNEVEVTTPPMRCCGMPALESGDLDLTQSYIRENLDTLFPLVEAGYAIVVPQPTCGYMLKQEYAWLSDDPRAKRVAAATMDLCEYLMALKERGKLKTDFREKKQVIAYHLPCHLKAQNIGYKSRDLLQLIPGTRVRLIDKCSGMDGTWGMKKETFEGSLAIADKLLGELDQAPADRVISDCTLAGLQIHQRGHKPVTHPIELVHEAYGLSFEV